MFFFWLIIVVVAYTLVFASGLLGSFLFGELLDSPSFPGKLTKSIPGRTNTLVYVTT